MGAAHRLIRAAAGELLDPNLSGRDRQLLSEDLTEIAHGMESHAAVWALARGCLFVAAAGYAFGAGVTCVVWLARHGWPA